MVPPDDQVHRSPAVELNIGLGTRILIKTKQFNTDIKSELVGLSKNEFLLIRMPLVPGARKIFMEEETIIVRYLAEGTIFGFSSILLKSVMKPTPLLFLEYPYTIERLDLRKAKRSNCVLECATHSKYGVLPGMIVDLSVGGCKLSVEPDESGSVPFKLSDMIVVECNLNNDASTQLHGVVRNISHNKFQSSLGVQFQNVEPDVEEAIDALISKLSGLA